MRKIKHKPKIIRISIFIYLVDRKCICFQYAVLLWIPYTNKDKRMWRRRKCIQNNCIHRPGKVTHFKNWHWYFDWCDREKLDFISTNSSLVHDVA